MANFILILSVLVGWLAYWFVDTVMGAGAGWAWAAGVFMFFNSIVNMSQGAIEGAQQAQDILDKQENTK